MKVSNPAITFQWDDGNINKNYEKHLITNEMSEEVFKDHNLITFPDPIHSLTEERFHLIGSTYFGDILFITYTIRKKQIRIISARVANKKERKIYEEQKV